MYDPNSKEVELGAWAQAEADRMLLAAGYLILDAHLSGQGRAALIRGRDGALIAMDNMDIRGGKTVLRDTKGKSQSTFWRYGNREQHGIDARNFDHYVAQCNEGGLEGHIAIVELSRERSAFGKEKGLLVPSRKLLIYLLDMFDRREDAEFACYGKDGMVYWNRADFLEQYDLETGEYEAAMYQGKML
jgi:hypothetical protein